MKQNYTQEMLLLYAYNEIATPQKVAIELALAEDKDLSRQFNELLKELAFLNNAVPQPTVKSIQKIIQHSRTQEKVATCCTELSH